MATFILSIHNGCFPNGLAGDDRPHQSWVFHMFLEQVAQFAVEVRRMKAKIDLKAGMALAA